MGRCGKLPRGGSAGKRGDHGRGGRDCGIDGWGAVVGGWDFAVDGLRLGRGELEIGGRDFAGRGACAMSIGDLRVGGRGEAWGRRVRFGAEGWGLRLAVCGLGLESAIRALALAAWGWGVIRATGVWGLGRSFGRTEVYGFARGLGFGRRDVACCLRFGPESGLGFRIWGLGFGRWGLTVCGLGWGLGFEAGIRCSRFAACCLEVAIRGWDSRHGAGA